MKGVLLTTTALTLNLVPMVSLSAQSEREEVLMVIERLFEGMRTADTALVRSTFHPEARIVAIDSRSGRQGSRAVLAEEFLAAVGASGGRWDERIWAPETHVDGEMAVVWAPYDFRVEGRFSHCGVDAFALARGPDGWKIVSIVYTRRTEGCEAPPGL